MGTLLGTCRVLGNMDLAKTGRIMKEKILKKEATCNGNKLRDSRHEFVAKDKFHPQSSEIYENVNQNNSFHLFGAEAYGNQNLSFFTGTKEELEPFVVVVVNDDEVGGVMGVMGLLLVLVECFEGGDTRLPELHVGVVSLITSATMAVKEAPFASNHPAGIRRRGLSRRRHRSEEEITEVVAPPLRGNQRAEGTQGWVGRGWQD
ncbi:hypothetical protein PIB30_019449 [Stylosanthes scabra]|uniref:Uncharacterized protein n=1 Tax=Stylosanthes scabra TaxID=79078 RepID=A0ABU6S867_9FABA|nr:hypothetical protein [Stylosanthes scabra]